MMGEMLQLLLPDDGVQVSHAHMFGSLDCLGHLVLMLLGQKRDDLSAYSAEPLYNLRLFLHLDIKPIGHLIIHDVMSVHLRLLSGQFLTFQLQTMVLGLEQLELLFDMVQCLQHCELHASMAWHQWSLRSPVRIHGVRRATLEVIHPLARWLALHNSPLFLLLLLLALLRHAPKRTLELRAPLISPLQRQQQQHRTGHRTRFGFQSNSDRRVGVGYERASALTR